MEVKVTPSEGVERGQAHVTTNAGTACPQGNDGILYGMRQRLAVLIRVVV